MPRSLIAIQARSGSKRLPGKSLRMMDDKAMVAHVFDTAMKSAEFINRSQGNTGLSAQVAILIPTDDPIKENFAEEFIVEGSEDDVLARFGKAYELYKPDYLVRITGDCPLIIPPLITKHVVSAAGMNLDYVSNAYEDLRTFVDGYDCEVISSEAFEWLLDNTSSPFDKEHVTTLLRREKPRWARFGVVLGHIDLSDIKLSVDTIEDFEECERKKKNLDIKSRKAKELGYATFRF
jgi:spore coat polysaccharide biosynthesis protein SpsF (cytidylyltransferase family)